MIQPRLSELNAVLAVAARGSFRGAAADLGLSPSSLSHAVAALEQRMGVRLFHRTTRSVSLSEAGVGFLDRIRPALLEISQAVESANEFRDTPKGTLRINSSEASARIALPLVLAFMARFRDMQVDLVADGRLVDIVAEGYDAGIRRQDAVPSDMISVPFGPALGYAVVGTPAYFRDREQPQVPDDLWAHACIRRRLPSGALFRWEFKRGEQEATLDVPGSLTLNDHNLVLAAARAGAGLAYLSHWFLTDDLASGRLVRVLEAWTPAAPGLSLYYPGHRHVPAGLRALVEMLQASRRSKPI